MTFGITYTTGMPLTWTLTSEPDVAPGAEPGPDIDIPPDDEPLDPTDDGQTVVDDTTPGGD